MTPLDYDYLRKLLKDRSGLMLSAEKQYLVESRLSPLARKAGLASLGELVAKLKSNDERLIVDVVEAMTTNESFLYSQFEVQRGLPIQMLVKYFAQIGDTWQIAPDIRAMAQFRPLNLLADFVGLGRFDVIFCRNVLIYFDQETKTGVLNRIGRQLEPDGYLVLGAAETVVGLTDAFKPVADKRGLYAPNKDKLKPASAVTSFAAVRPFAVAGAR